MRTALSLMLAAIVVTLTACPGGAESARATATEVGAAPHAQLEEARAKIEKAERQQKAALEAAAAAIKE
jgi:hypothetical protein